MRLRLPAQFLAVTVVLLAGAPPGAAQTASSSIPRTSDGRPDFSGIWQALTTASWDIQDHAAQKGVPGGPGIVVGNEIPYQPAALARKKQNYDRRATDDPVAKCYLPGVPRLLYMPFPFQIVQTPTELMLLFEFVHAVRFVFLTGRHPPGPIEWWLGDSRARWEGDTLVVDVVHFTPNTWFDRTGNYHSEALHVVERYTLMDPNTIAYEATIEDPQVFTRPWTLRMLLYRRVEPNVALLDYDCYAFEWEKYYPYPGL